VIRAVRAGARALLAYVFASSGLATLRDPTRATQIASSTLDPICRGLPEPVTPTLLVRVNAAVHLSAGTLLATGRLPRLAAGALAVSLVPTTAAGHAFWKMDDPTPRAQQRIHFAKNLAIIGALLLVATSEARPDSECEGR
jgi:putative oxidoreductase